MSSSNCCFLTWIQVSQKADKVIWYSHLFKNFPPFVVIHTVKGFGIVNKAEVDVLLELSCFPNDPMDVGNLISGSSAFPKTSLNIWKFMVHILLKPGDFCSFLIVFELFQILKDDAVKVLHSICQQIWETQQWPQDWKSQFSFQYQRRAMPKNVKTTTQLHSSHTLVK